MTNDAPANAHNEHRKDTDGDGAKQGKIARTLQPLKKGLAKLKCRHKKGVQPPEHNLTLLLLEIERCFCADRPTDLCSGCQNLRSY
jgi:hypothetical protein